MFVKACIKCIQANCVNLWCCQSSGTSLAPLSPGRNCLAGDHIYTTLLRLHPCHLTSSSLWLFWVLDIYSPATCSAFMSSLLYSKALHACETKPLFFSIIHMLYWIFSIPFFLFDSKQRPNLLRCVCQKLLWGSVLVKRAEGLHWGIWNAPCVGSKPLHTQWGSW